MATWNYVNIGSDNGMLPEGTKPLPESMLFIIGEVPWQSSRALSLDDVKIPINKTRLKIAVLKWHLGLPGAV